MQPLRFIPQPREVNQQRRTIQLSPDWTICRAADAPEDRYAAEILNAELRDCLGWTLAFGADGPAKKRIELVRRNCGKRTALFRSQGYQLTVAAGCIEIAAPSAAGIFYGAQTLRQILRQCPDGRVPQLEITDWPALAWRGVSDDISRGQISTLENFLRIIRDLAYYKLNLYQPYIEDMFCFAGEPAIGAGRGPLTPDELAAMAAEAKKNHVRLIPILNCLGHQERLLAIPHLRKFAEIKNPTPEVPLRSFCAVDRGARHFVKKMIDEFAAAVDSPYFHIGGDESWDIGLGGSKRAVARLGAGRVHAEYFADLVEYLRGKHGRTAMLYADMLLEHPETLELLPKDCVYVDWEYRLDTDYPSVRLLKSRGAEKILISPGLWNWNAFYPHYSRAFVNIARAASVARREKILGLVVSSWGDSGAENLRENNWPGYAFAADCCWAEGARAEDYLWGDLAQAPGIFLRRFTAAHYGADDAELAEAHLLTGWVDCLEDKFPGSWMHQYPRLGRNMDYHETKLELLLERSGRAREILGRRRNVRQHSGQLALLAHAARRYHFIARREQFFASHQYAPQKLQALADELRAIKDEFESLWLAANKRPMLDFDLERLQKQIDALRKLQH